MKTNVVFPGLLSLLSVILSAVFALKNGWDPWIFGPCWFFSITSWLFGIIMIREYFIYRNAGRKPTQSVEMLDL